jgi:PAS domain S-box-containing protein
MQVTPVLAMLFEPAPLTTLVIAVLLVLLTGAVLALVVSMRQRRRQLSATQINEASSQILLNTLGDPAYLIDPNGTILDMNDTARRIGNLPPGSSMFAPLPANLAASRKAAVQQVLQTGQPMLLEDVYAGEYSKVRMVPIHDATGTVTRVAVTSRDVTEQRKLEATLTSTIQFLQQILESSRTIAIISTDAAGLVGFWNAGAETLFGYTSEEVVGKRSITSLLAADNANDFARLVGMMASVVGRQIAIADTFAVAHKTGAVRLMRMTFSPQVTEAVKVQGLLVVGEDITEQATARRDSEQAERKLRLLAFTLNCAKDAFILTDLENHILYVNQAFVDTYGYSEDEVLGRDIRILRSSGEQFDRTQQIHAEAQSGGWVGELMNRRKNGETFPVELWTSMVRNDAGEPVAMVGVAREITERKRSEARVQASLREKEVLLKEVHHRVKNNLQVITSLLNLQADRISDERVQVVLRENQARIKSMALVHEELYQSEDLAWVNFTDYLRRLTNGLIQSYARSGKTIDLRLELEDLRLGIDAAIPCGLIVNELLTNALHHAFVGRPAGTVAIRFSKEQGKYILGVVDDGIGLPVSIDVGTTDTLGLHLVSTLTDQLRGSLSVSREGGTSFLLVFEEHIERPVSPAEH